MPGSELFRYGSARGEPEAWQWQRGAFPAPVEGQHYPGTLSGPEEAFEAILAVARHEVDMDAGDALADAVVDYASPFS
jgi:hypothetical protein